MNDFSLLYARHRQNHRPEEILPKVLRYTELTLVLDGRMEYAQGETRLTLEAGDVLFLKKGSVRSRRAGEDYADYISLNFNMERQLSLPVVIRGGITGEIRFCLEAMDRILQKRHLENSTEELGHLILTILLALEDGIREKKVHPLVHKITLYLHQHLSEKITLQAVAEHCFFSPVYCDSVFKRETGQAIVEYLLKLRIEQAKLLLIQGQYSISQIGEMTGFADSNYFSRQFKKKVGETPSQYRKRIQR